MTFCQMADLLTKEKRSWNMSRIKNRNTGPERVVRSMLHRMGYRFKLHESRLPGRPDVVLPKHKTVVFVHGCFWHHHKHCKDATIPKTRTDWWRLKLEGNAKRDRANARKLRKLGWRVLLVWECEITNPKLLSLRLSKFLS